VPKTYLNPQTLFESQKYGFSQVVASRGGTTVYISGQVGWDAREQMADSNDLGAQARRALENVEAAVQAAGGTRDDVVSLRLYIVGAHIHQAGPVGEALRSFFHHDRQPTSSWIGVGGLARPEFLIEIEAVAVVE